MSGSTVAASISGNNATRTNLGTITQIGTGRAICDNTGVTEIVINDGSVTNLDVGLRPRLHGTAAVGTRAFLVWLDAYWPSDMAVSWRPG